MVAELRCYIIRGPADQSVMLWVRRGGLGQPRKQNVRLAACSALVLDVNMQAALDDSVSVAFSSSIVGCYLALSPLELMGLELRHFLA